MVKSTKTAPSITTSLMTKKEDLSALARRVPMWKESHNKVEDSKREQEYNELVTICDVLSKESQYIIPLHGHLMSLIRNTQVAGNNDEMLRDATNLNKMDDDFIIQFIARRSKLEVTTLARVKSNDPEGLALLMQYGLQIPRSAKLPSELKYKKVAELVFEKRHTEVGKRFGNMKEGFISKEGAIDWTMGCYSFTWARNRVEKVIHADGTTTTLPDFVTITKAFAFKDNHDDQGALVNLQGCQYVLKGFFIDEKKGPLSYVAWAPRAQWLKHSAQEVYKASKANEDEKDKQKATAADEFSKANDSLALAQKEAKQEQAKRARAAFDKKKGELAEKRRVKLQ